MELNEILKKYEALESEILYDEAMEIIKLITDEEYEKLVEENKDLFTVISEMSKSDLLHNPDLIRESISLFINIIENRPKVHPLSKGEYDVMTKDDIIEYLGTLFKSSDSVTLFPIIKGLEEVLNVINRK